MTKGFAGKVALVTGGGSGIGRASAVAFAKQGARVAIADLDEDGARATARAIQLEGGEAMALRVDVSRAAEVEAMVDAVVRAYGRLDCAHNNAGVLGALAPTAACTEETWDHVVSTNLRGVWLCMKHEIQQMLRQGGGGAIVNTASVWGLVGTAMGVPAYVASKHGVVGLTRAAALEYATSGIRINAICPGVVQTPFTAAIFAERPETKELALALEPVGRMANPGEIAQSVVWLCSDAASFVVGSAMSVDGGMTAG